MNAAVLATLAALAATVGCARKAAATSDPGDRTSSPPQDAAPVARCAAGEPLAMPGDPGDRRALVVGNAAALGDGVEVGLVQGTPGGPVAEVARLGDPGRADLWIVARPGALVPDAPPPIPLVAGGDLYAAVMTRSPEAGASRRITLRKRGAEEPLASFPVESSDSLSFDAAVAGGGARLALAWDDDGARDGGIRVAIVSRAGGPAPRSRIVSDGVTDVDAPRIVARPGGWWAAWIGRREETTDGGSVLERLERPGEAPAFSWIELVALDDDGAPAGPVRRLTPAGGHAVSFDLAPRARGELDVFARDEAQRREGEGGAIVHVVASLAIASDPAIVVWGAGRAAVDYVAAADGDGWLAFTDPQDRARVLPLDGVGGASGVASAEDALDGARLLLAAPSGGASRASRFVAALPTSDAAVFRTVTCLR